MPRPPRSRTPIKQAAVQLFVERGIHATGIRDIAQAAGYSEAALYRHWKNKESLIRALFHEHVEEVVALLDQALSQPGSPRQRLSAGVHAAYELYDAQPHVFRFVLMAQHEFGPYLPGDVRMPQQVIEDMVRDLQPNCGQPAPLLAAAMIGIFLECSSRVIYGHLPGPMGSYSDAVTDMCLRVLQLDDAARPAP